MSSQRTLLVAGASGLVGYAVLRHFASLPGWNVIGLSRRIPTGLEGVRIISADLTNRSETAEVIEQLGSVTHVVYAALYEKPDLIAGWRDPEQMQTNASMLENVLSPLLESARGLEHVTLLQGTKAYGTHIETVPVPARERWPRHAHENFYWLQEDFLRSRQSGQDWHWTVLRPQVIFGESLGSHMNMIPAIGVYGAVLKAAGEPLHFPGGAPRIFQAVDADLLARACAWAAGTPACRNQIYNINNGEAIEWRTVWPAIADALGMEVGGDRPMSLAEEMPKHEDAWRRIVKEHKLAVPATLAEFVGLSFQYADRNFNYGVTTRQPPTLVSTVKARLDGFADCVDSEEMFRRLIRRCQNRRWLPQPSQDSAR